MTSDKMHGLLMMARNCLNQPSIVRSVWKLASKGFWAQQNVFIPRRFATSASLLPIGTLPVVPAIFPAPLSSPRRSVNILVVDASGRITEATRSVTQLKQESRLHMRELLIVEQPSSPIQPRILPRRHCIVATLGQVRAIVFTDRVYLFSYNLLPGARDFASSIASQLQQLSAKASIKAGDGSNSSVSNEGSRQSGSGGQSEREDAAPFELLIIEQALLTITLKHAKRVAYARKLLDRLLSKMGTVERDDGNLYALFPLANTISHYELMTRGICDCVRALLDDDRDMREACLSEKAKISGEIAAEAAAWSKAQVSAYDEQRVGDDSPTADGHPPFTPVEGSEAYAGVPRSPIASLRTITNIMNSGASARTAASRSRLSVDPLRAAPHVHDFGHQGGLLGIGEQDRRAVLSDGMPGSSSSSTRIPDSSLGSFSWPNSHPLSGAGSYDGGGDRRDMPVPASASMNPAGGAAALALLDDSRILRINTDALSQVELMLESIYHRAAELNMEAVELGRTIRNKQDLLELQQSNYRNFILSVTLRMSVLSVSIASATFVTSAFGQNLVSGVDNIPGGMWGVTVFSGALGWYLFRALEKITVSSSPTAAYARRLQTFSDFLLKLDSKVDAARTTLAAAAGSGTAASAAAAAAGMSSSSSSSAPFAVGSTSMLSRMMDFGRLSPFRSRSSTSSTRSGSMSSGAESGGGLSMGMEEGVEGEGEADMGSNMSSRGRSGGPSLRGVRPLSRSEFKELHARTTERTLSDDEVELLFELFDADADGRLRIEEVVDVGTLSTGMGQAGNQHKKGEGE